ncbi:MAG: serine/threonine-protein kinase [Polyangia bacterium]
MATLEGRYELLELLSSGGMGSVHRARHRQLNRIVAIKFMSPTARADAELRDRFMHEARIASSFVHPNIVGVTDFGIDEERGYFIVMEHLAGHTLRDRMNEQPMRARVACDIVEQCAWALRHIHSRGVLHCDLKPENVFLAEFDEESRRRNHVKLIDFGLAFHPTEPSYSLAGTPPYLAPERLRGAPPSPAADLYALGSLFYEILTGRPPYEGQILDMVDQQLSGSAPPAPSELMHERLEARTDDVIMRAIAFDPAQRPQTAEAFLFELRTLMSMMGMRVRRVARSTHGPVRRTGAAPAVTRRIVSTVARAHPRVPVQLAVKVHRDDDSLEVGVTENLSPGGAFVVLPAGLPIGLAIGTEVLVDLPLQKEEAVRLRAVVRWQRLGKDDTQTGYGLQWLDVSESMQQRLALATAPCA